MAERRIDPADGHAYTYDELAEYYSGKFKKKVILTYWDECAPVRKIKKRGKRQATAQQAHGTPVTASGARAEKELAGAISQFRLACARAASLGLSSYPRGELPALNYGTAGFRTRADLLPHVMYRMGILAALRARTVGQTVGVMVTASHNPEADNGVKLVESDGSMLPIEWEVHATRLANATDDTLGSVIEHLATDIGAIKAKGRQMRIIIGRDTRASSGPLAAAVAEGAGSLAPFATWMLGLVSTPQLHFVVRCQRTRPFYGKGTIAGYFDKLIKSYLDFLTAVDEQQSTPRKKYMPKVVVDCANGVGAKVMSDATPRLADRLAVKVVKAGDGALNEGCGADYVKVKQSAPLGIEPLETGERGVSFDGDADRVVYFCSPGGKFALLDGDRIATLLVAFISAQLAKCEIDDLRIGIVQTAYANGASTKYARSKGIKEENLVCAKTGVKHLHHSALDMDVGVYFEANGHGTVVFSRKFGKKVQKAATVPETQKSARLLLLFQKIINETVGDAFSDFLAVEAVLYASDMSAEDWLGEYDDLPNKQTKVTVADRGVFETTNAERTCVKPVSLQEKIDELVAAAGPDARSFVRPSGTEDVVRVYAEASTPDAMNELSMNVARAVYDLAGGVGIRP